MFVDGLSQEALLAYGGKGRQVGCDDHLRCTVHCCVGVERLDEADFIGSVHHNAAIGVGKVALCFSFRICLLRVRYLRVVRACLVTGLRFRLPTLRNPRFNWLPLSLFLALSLPGLVSFFALAALAEISR